MSAARDKIKREHERANIRAFLDWHRDRYRSAFKVISEPDPPDAVIQSGRTLRWVEFTDAFWTDAYARDEYTYATPGEKHKPIRRGTHADMDQVFAGRFVTLLRQKLEKRSYEPYRDKYGPGYLVILVINPFFTATTVQFMKAEWARAVVSDRGCFRSVYIACRSRNGLALQRWPDRR